MLSVATPPARATRETFGRLADGRAVEAITLANSRGISVRVLALGAAIQSLTAPDRRGDSADIALGLATVEDYLLNPAYIGVTLGRYANRLARGRFTLDGKPYQLATNDGPHSLHGGPGGFGRALWSVGQVSEGTTASVTLSLQSPDGDDGFPGALTATAAFALHDDRITIHYRATSDAPTIVNLSNHTYFNLAGDGASDSILQHRLTVPADAFLPIDSSGIPTGEFRDVRGTPFDFRTATAIGQRIRDAADEQIRNGRGYDHTWVCGRSPAATPRLLARLHHAESGRILEVSSTQPGLQCYTGNHLNGTMIGKTEQAYRQSDGVSLEPQLFPDTPNQPRFGSARLAPGELYENRIIYRLTADRAGTE